MSILNRLGAVLGLGLLRIGPIKRNYRAIELSPTGLLETKTASRDGAGGIFQFLYLTFQGSARYFWGGRSYLLYGGGSF